MLIENILKVILLNNKYKYDYNFVIDPTLKRNLLLAAVFFTYSISVSVCSGISRDIGDFIEILHGPSAGIAAKTNA